MDYSMTNTALIPPGCPGMIIPGMDHINHINPCK